MRQYYGLILTFIAGLFFLIGGLISLKVKNKNKLNVFSVGLAFIIIINLLISDLLPEIWELLASYTWLFKLLFLVVFGLLGILILRGLDFFIPDHHHEHHDDEVDTKAHMSHLKHIGSLTFVSIILHNLLEGFAIAGMALTDFKIGLMVGLSVALHNIPLGTHIFSSIDMREHKGITLVLTISSLLGGLIFLLIGDISNLVLAVISIITLGMLIYILGGELWPELRNNIRKKEAIFGVGVGIIIVLASIFI